MQLHEVHWEITNRCNLRCKHCLPMSGPPRPGELTTEESLAALEKFKAAGASKLYITGGEPFARADILRVLEKGVGLEMRLTVITNATLLKESVLEKIKLLGIELGISLEGADEKTHDAIRGCGNFKITANALTQCQARSIPTTLYVTITAKNVTHVEALARFAKDHGCKGIHLNDVTIAGRAISFADELTLSVEQRKQLPELVCRTASSVWGETLSDTDDSCWVDGETFYMTADGKLYACSEVFQRRPDLAIGNIRSFVFEKWFEQSAHAYKEHRHRCCYGVQVSNHMVVVKNTAPECAFAPQEPSIQTLQQLYDVLDELYMGIEGNCHECGLCGEYPDCIGYVWVLPVEAERLYEKGVPLLEINRGPTFINPFPESTPEHPPDLSVRYPTCSQLCTQNRSCIIHADRPLVCRLYPLGLETTKEGEVVWALHLDCLHVRKLTERGMLPDFESRARNILNNFSPELLQEIVKTYRAVDAISSFPNGENNYKILQEVHYVKM